MPFVPTEFSCHEMRIKSVLYKVPICSWFAFNVNKDWYVPLSVFIYSCTVIHMVLWCSSVTVSILRH